MRQEEACLRDARTSPSLLKNFVRILMAAVLGALLLFAAPILVGFLTGLDEEGYVQEGSLFGIPGQPRVHCLHNVKCLQLWIL